MLKGTRILDGKEATDFRNLTQFLRKSLLELNFTEVIVPNIWEASTFKNKIKGETLGQMWTFYDKGDRECCLIPEVTGIIQEIYNESWSKSHSKPVKIFYESRAYRYERPQAGRYREFTQFGIEILGGNKDQNKELSVDILVNILDSLNLEYRFNPKVARGLGYYTEDGFEVECDTLGAQKQIAGGGTYQEGVGWAIGIDRLLIALR